MNCFLGMYCRSYQAALNAASYFVEWRKPELLEGEGSLSLLPKKMKENGHKRVLIVSDSFISSLEMMEDLREKLESCGIRSILYNRTMPNPTVGVVEEALRWYQNCFCDCLIAFGGGSVMDTAKAVAARVVNPSKSLGQMKGVQKVGCGIPPLYVIPTTAGTGSEATIAAVITDPDKQTKYQIDDTRLVPRVAVLDPLVTLGLPPHLTATTGMDALTHAIESYINRFRSSETLDMSRKAVNLIFENLHRAYEDGSDVTARDNMLKASHYAGIAFTRGYVGYVHAIAHALGGKYNIAHGLANAVILPYVLEYYGDCIDSRLAELCRLTDCCFPELGDHQNAVLFIEAIKELNRSMGIPEKLEGIRDEDIDDLVDHAYNEANPFYPVPRILGKNDLRILFNQIRK